MSGSPATPCNQPTGNIEPLLHEVRHALERLIKSGDESIIDLRSLPLAPGEEEALEKRLGTGELSARLDALGPTTLQETAYAGVWLVTHRNEADEITGRFIEISFAPELLKSQHEDIVDGIARLTAELEQGTDP